NQFDKAAPSVAEIKVFTLAKGDATAMAALLEKLFGTATGGSRGESGEAASAQVAGAEDASSGIVPIRFSVDVRTNSIIAIGGPESLRVAEAVLLRLDTSEIQQRQSSVFRLKNSPALAVADSVNQFIQQRRQVENLDQSLVSPFEQIEREVVVVPEEV